jgi:Tol biopolymer transport system component
MGEVLAEVAKHRKVSPDILAKLLRGDLDLIIMKTLEKDRTRRYERAVELAADVERHLNNKPVLAAPPSMTYRLRKFVRRNRVAVITVCLVVAALSIGTITTTVTFLSSERMTVKVEQPTPNYRLVLDEQIAGMPVGRCDFSPSGDRIVFKSEGNLYITDQTATKIRPLLDDLGSWEFVSPPRWSPDGRLIAYSLSREAPPDSNAMIISAVFVLNPDGGAPRQIGPDITVPYFIRIFWTPDGQHINYRSRDIVRTLTLDGREVRSFTSRELPFVAPLDGSSYSPNGRWIVFDQRKEDASGSDLCILPVTGGTWRRFTNLPGSNHWPAWAPDGRTLYLVSGSNIWKLPMDQETGLANGEPQQVTFFKDAFIEGIKVLGDGSRIAFGMSKMNTYLQVADASSPQEARSLVQCGIYTPELSPDGKTIYYMNDTPGEEGIYAITRDGSASLRLTESLPLGNRTGFVPLLDLSPDGRTLAYSAKLGDEHAIFTLPVNGGESRPLVRLARKWGSDTVPQWSSDGSQLAYVDGNDLNVIPAAGGQPRQLANINPGYWAPYSIRWSPDGKFIAAYGILNLEKSNAVFVVPASGGELQQITPDERPKQGLEWHPDGQYLTYTVFRADGATYQAYLDGREPTLLVDAPDISDWIGTWAPDGRRYFFLGFAASKMGMYVYDESTGKTTLVSDSGNVSLPCFSRNGTTMAWWACRRSSFQTWIMEDFLPESTAGK